MGVLTLCTLTVLLYTLGAPIWHGGWSRFGRTAPAGAVRSC